jgi:hypothetical protein
MRSRPVWATNLLDKLNSRKETMEESISKLEDKTIEITQSEQKENILKNAESWGIK